MSGPTMVMAPAMESSGLSRSHSTPELMSLSSFSYHHGHHDADSDPDSDRNLPQHLDSDHAFEVPSFGDHFELDTSLSLSSDAMSLSSQPAQLRQPEAESGSASNHTLHHEPQLQPQPQPLAQLRRSRTGSLMERPRSWFVSSKSMAKLPLPEQPDRRPQTSVGEDRTHQVRRPASSSARVHESLTGLAKRSWLSSSRSSSPKRRPNTSKGDRRDRSDPAPPVPDILSTSPSSTQSTANSTSSASTGPSPAQPPQNRPSEASTPFNRATSYLNKIKKPKQPLSLKKLTTVHDSDNNSVASSAASLAPPISTSTETRNSQSTSCDSNTTATDDSSTDMPPSHTSGDPLWSSFKTLELEHKGFKSRSAPQRVIQIQTIVHPFMRSTMDHPSTKKLSPEHLDRRATILNSWWTSMLDMLSGPGLGSVPGVDRPLMFDTLIAIMLRSEWRQATTQFLPLSERSPRERIKSRTRKEVALSTGSSDDGFIIEESAEHNVRTMFICCLARQLGFAVDKMATRFCPQTLVTFAGHTCAYAFFFVPGAADMLVRLWGVGHDLIRRAADELGLPRKDSGESDDIVALFPSNLSHLGWTTPKATWDDLKRIPQIPLLISRIAWTGPWMSRWKGRETDLLFVFFKQFYILADDFMPPGLPLTEKARSPAFALVHAQLLSVVDDTIHRHAALGGPGMMDSVMPGADASAMAMQLPPPNLMKGMAECSLVMLMKDVLADENLDKDGAKHTFAESCVAMIKAAVRRTSQYDNPACFTLCDFLEETLAVYDGFEDHVSSKKYIDWPFWLDVFQRIFRSLNTMSEVRVLSFVYAIWDMVAKDSRRKEAICLDWLLTEEVFEAFFNNWCPMVRAYYHRLLCWRICRFEGGADEVDTKIFLRVAERLKTTWSHYLYAKEAAEGVGRSPPATAPMVPTPGKKFMIIRQEVNQPQPGLFVNFDSLAKTPGSDVISGEDLSGAPKPESKKKSSLLGKVLSFGQSGSGKNQERRASWDEEFTNVRRETAELRSRASGLPRIATSPTGSDSDSACSSPLYEEQKYVFKFFLAWHQPSMPPRERTLMHPRLPAPTQAVVSLEPHGMDDPSPTVRRASPTSEMAMAMEASDAQAESDDEEEPEVTPTKPTGLSAKNSAYCGRALAEWSQVVWECNCFVDRRCDEGVPGLREVEVPVLGVESFRKLGG